MAFSIKNLGRRNSKRKLQEEKEKIPVTEREASYVLFWMGKEIKVKLCWMSRKNELLFSN